MSFDLENLDNEIKSGKTTEQAEGVSGGLAKLTAGQSLDDIYDRNQKFIFAFDESGSMLEGIVPGEIDQVAVWTEDIVQKLRAALITYAKAHISAWSMTQARQYFTSEVVALQGAANEAKSSIEELTNSMDDIGDEDKEEVEEEIADLKATIKEIEGKLPKYTSPTEEMLEEQAITSVLGFDPQDTQALKMAVFVKGLDTTVGLPIMKTGLGLSSISKMDTVKTAAKGFITQRLDKFPNADIMILEFDHRVKVGARKATRAELLQRIDGMKANYDGGTDIFKVVNAAVEECKKRPAHLGANRIVLVSDGASPTVRYLAGLIPTMKEKGIVFDFVYIKGNNESSYGESTYIAEITAITSQTNGQVHVVDNAQAFSKKFFEVASRKCLPPAKE